jgi:hypothetical protein
MRLLLEPSLSELLQSRVYLSREGKILKIQQIIDEWKISKATLNRYISPKYRLASRTASYKQFLLERQRDKTKCYRCAVSLEYHPRCELCTILIHDIPCDCPQRFSLLH